MWDNIKNFYGISKVLSVIIEIFFLFVGVWNVIYLITTGNDISLLGAIVVTVIIEILIHVLIFFVYAQLF